MELFDILEDLYKRNIVCDFELETLLDLTIPLSYSEAEELEELLNSHYALNIDEGLQILRDNPNYMPMIKGVLNEDDYYIFSKMAVYDRKSSKFYPCDFGEHFKCIRNVMEVEYPDKYQALMKYTYFRVVDTDYTQNEIDDFIMNTFYLIGNTCSLQEHLK